MKLTTYLALFIIAFQPVYLTGQNSHVQVSSHTYKDTLQLDFYSPESAKYETPPLLVLLHGGGFASGTRNGANEVLFCQTMADKGFAVASISYRLTRKGDPFNCQCHTEKKMQSFVSACEDLSEAISYLTNEKDLTFDRETIILIGSSAGAEAILHSAYMRNDYRFTHIPEFKISGLISFSGAVSNAAYITKKNAIPTLMIHGKKDKLVPYATSPHHFCPEDQPGYLMLDGPKTIASSLQALDASYIVAFDNEGGHEWADDGYYQIALISRFIHTLVLKGEKIQEIVELMPAVK